MGFHSFSGNESSRFNDNSSTKRYQQESRFSSYNNDGVNSSVNRSRFDNDEEIYGSDFRDRRFGKSRYSDFDYEHRNSFNDNDFDSRRDSIRNRYVKSQERNAGGSFSFINNSRSAILHSRSEFDRVDDRDFNDSYEKVDGYGRGVRNITDKRTIRDNGGSFISSYSFDFGHDRQREDNEKYSSRGNSFRGFESDRRNKSEWSDVSRIILICVVSRLRDNETNEFETDGFRRGNNYFSSDKFREKNLASSKFGSNDDDKIGQRFSREKGLNLRSTYVPVDRYLEDLYKEDEKNAQNMAHIEDIDLEVHVEGHNVDVKTINLESWEDAGFDEKILENLRRCRYDRPRRIQSAVIPLITNNYDLLGHAETGGGKTVAFLLPIIDHIVKIYKNSENSSCAPVALIIAPTRELVLQLYDQARKLAAGTVVSVAKAYGRYDVATNISELRRGCDLLFATLGRLWDFVNRGIVGTYVVFDYCLMMAAYRKANKFLSKIVFKRLEYLVLDEADRMLESLSGFQAQVLDLVRSDGFPQTNSRHTLLFSATFDDVVLHFARDLLKEEYVFVTNGRNGAANALVDQHFIMVTKSAKGARLHMLVKLLNEDKEKYNDIRQTLVFVAQQNTTDVVSLFLSHSGIKAISIHGGREQREREEALNGFRRGDIKVLVSTDVCARGIDIVNLDHVVNFDLPTEKLFYIHRIGRTGRLRRGTATSFINVNLPSDVAFVPKLIEAVREVNQEVPRFMLDLVQGFRGYLPETVDKLDDVNERIEKLSCGNPIRGLNEAQKSSGTTSVTEKFKAEAADDDVISDNEGWE
uniref:RNA helicase n=1 Tax=Syphacia muris TaxID=451379 RepID=A0A0N5AJT4_9BILA